MGTYINSQLFFRMEVQFEMNRNSNPDIEIKTSVWTFCVRTFPLIMNILQKNIHLNENLWIMKRMKTVLFRQEVEEVVGRVKEGCSTHDLRLCGQELNAALMRPHTHSPRQSPIRDLDVMHLFHTVIYHPLHEPSSVTARLCVIVTILMQACGIVTQAFTHRAPRCTNSLGSPVYNHWVLTGLQPFQHQPTVGCALIFFSTPSFISFSDNRRF